jgi:hypothetical protein
MINQQTDTAEILTAPLGDAVRVIKLWVHQLHSDLYAAVAWEDCPPEIKKLITKDACFAHEGQSLIVLGLTDICAPLEIVQPRRKGEWSLNTIGPPQYLPKASYAVEAALTLTRNMRGGSFSEVAERQRELEQRLQRLEKSSAC